MGAGRPLDDQLLLLDRRILDLEVEHEPVELGLGQRIGPFHLDRVLGRDDEERRIERIGPPPDRDLALLHRLQQCGLRLGGRAVDLVGQQEVGEDRSGEELQLAPAGGRVLLDDVHAGDVRGHQVGRELDAAELQVERSRQRAGHQGLAQAGYTEQKDVTATEQPDEHVVDDRFLADDHLGDLFADALARLAQASHDGGVFARERLGTFGLVSRVRGVSISRGPHGLRWLLRQVQGLFALSKNGLEGS